MNITCPACGSPALATPNNDRRLALSDEYLIQCTKCDITRGNLTPPTDFRLG